MVHIFNHCLYNQYYLTYLVVIWFICVTVSNPTKQMLLDSFPQDALVPIQVRVLINRFMRVEMYNVFIVTKMIIVMDQMI